MTDRQRIAACQGKQRYTAQRAKELAQRIRKRSGARVMAYRCQYCRGWHIGNTMRKRTYDDL